MDNLNEGEKIIITISIWKRFKSWFKWYILRKRDFYLIGEMLCTTYKIKGKIRDLQ